MRLTSISTITVAFVMCAGASMSHSATCPPPSVTLDGTSNATTSCVVSADSDWQQRTSAPGVFYRNNFTYTNKELTSQMTTSAQLRASAYNGGGTPAMIEFDTQNKLSGAGSCRFNMPAANRGVYSDLGFTFDGVGVTSKNTIKHEFYLQFAVFADSVYRNFYYGDGNTFGGKIVIVMANNVSAVPGGIVFRRDNWAQTGAVRMYFYNRSGDIVHPLLSWAPSGVSDFTTYPFYDRGFGSVTSVNSLQARHGPTWSGRDSGASDPDVVNSGAPFLVANGWTTFEIYVKQVSSGTGIVKVWAAPYGEAPKLIMGTMTANLPLIGATDDANINAALLYTGFQLGNYPNAVSAWPSTDTFLAYDELIASDQPINFPGGHALPSPGTSPPAGYPPAGAALSQ